MSSLEEKGASGGTYLQRAMGDHDTGPKTFHCLDIQFVRQLMRGLMSPEDRIRDQIRELHKEREQNMAEEAIRMEQVRYFSTLPPKIQPAYLEYAFIRLAEAREGIRSVEAQCLRLGKELEEERSWAVGPGKPPYQIFGALTVEHDNYPDPSLPYSGCRWCEGHICYTGSSIGQNRACTRTDIGNRSLWAGCIGGPLGKPPCHAFLCSSLELSALAYRDNTSSRSGYPGIHHPTKVKGLSSNTMSIVALMTFLSFCNPAYAVGDTDPPGHATGPATSWIPLGVLALCLWSASILDRLGAKYLSLAMFTLSLSWPIVRTDPRSPTGLLYAVYLGAIASTVAYGHVAFSTHENRHMSVLCSILLASACSFIILLASQDGLQVMLTTLPFVISLSFFIIANWAVITTYLKNALDSLWLKFRNLTEAAFHCIGEFLTRVGRRWQRRSHVSDEGV